MCTKRTDASGNKGLSVLDPNWPPNAFLPRPHDALVNIFVNAFTGSG